MTEKKNGLLSVFCSQLQTTQFTERQAVRPGQHGTAGYATQYLLTSPQRFAPVLCVDQQQVFQRQSTTIQGRRVGDPRRVNHDDAVLILAETRERR